MSYPKKITLTFEVDRPTDEAIRQSSIERVINCSMDLVGELKDDRASRNYEDCEEFKPVICTIWNAVWNALFIETYPSTTVEENDRKMTLKNEAEEIVHKLRTGR